MNKPYYCVYCNRERDPARGPDEKKTREHFIPQSVGGEWCIDICHECNRSAGASCDRALSEIAKILFTIRVNGLVEADGVAILTSTQELPVHFRYQTLLGGASYLHTLRRLDGGADLKRSEIYALKFKLPNIQEMVNMAPSVFSKIAIGALYFCDIKYRPGARSSVNPFFTGLILAKIRELFLGSRFNVSGSGTVHAPRMSFLDKASFQNFLRSRNNPSIRRHYIGIEQKDREIFIRICLFSQFFFQVVIPDCETGSIIRCDEEVELPDLEKLDLDKHGINFLRADDVWINLILGQREASAHKGT